MANWRLNGISADHRWAFDGKSIYFTSADVTAEVWVTSVNGGEETAVLRKALGMPLALGRDDLHYLSNTGSNRARLAI
jgi:hypothetical protein